MMRMWKRLRNVLLVLLIVVIPIITWQVTEYEKVTDTGNRLLIVLTSMLAFFTFLTWLTYERLADLSDRQNWFTGSLESHSTIQLFMRAHELGIPVMYWDPTIEKCDIRQLYGYGDTRHRKIAKPSFIVLFVPERERDPTRRPIKFKPLTANEKRAIEDERRRLSGKSTRRSKK